jgi:hypothetical protein
LFAGNDPFGSSSRNIDDMFAANPAHQRAQYQREKKSAGTTSAGTTSAGTPSAGKS